MWPSEETASRLYDLANWGLLVGLVVGVISTGMLVWMGNLKETYLKRELAATGERASVADEHANALEKSNLELQKDVASLQNEASSQRERAAIAERALIDLQKHNEPRRLSPEQVERIADKMRPFASQHINLFAYGGENEVVGISKDLISALGPYGAGLAVSVSHGSEIGRAISGILIEFKATADAKSRSAAAAVASALTAEGLAVDGPQLERVVAGTIGTGNTDSTAAIRIVIGKKK